MTQNLSRDPGSFRDPAGFVYRRDGVLYRQIDRSFADQWEAVRRGGILDRLIAAGLLVSHEPVPVELAAHRSSAYAVIRPAEVDFVSYPHEWSFGMLRDAALLTLTVEADARAHGFTLRDASSYNISFHRGRPILIDTLSIAPLVPDAPWRAYRQFCEHFLAPLAVMARRDIRLGELLRTNLDGIPLDLTARLLPARTRLELGLGSHIHLHARAQRRHERAGDEAGAKARRTTLSRTRHEALIDSLHRTISGLNWEPTGTEWAGYEDGDLLDAARAAKDAIVHSMLESAGGRVVWDLGANVGRHSAIAASMGRRVVAWDRDPAAVERHYRAIRERGEEAILPLVVDLANPSPGLGWALEERRSFLDRADPDVVLALALVHHLAIGRNVPLGRIADLCARLGQNAIVEWVGRNDPMVQRLLATREDVFEEYTLDGFRGAFGAQFELVDEQLIPGTDRRIIRMLRR